MIEINIDYNGLWAGLSDKPYREKTVIRVARATLKEVMVEFANRKGRASLDFRFTDAAFSVLDLAPRSEKYQKRQKRVLGRVRPFFSPTRKSAHMQNIIRIPDVGHRVALRNFGKGGEGIIVTRLSLPGARPLNAASLRKGRRPTGRSLGYASEFLNLTRPGTAGFDGVSARWIRMEFAERFPSRLKEALRRKPRKKVKAA